MQLILNGVPRGNTNPKLGFEAVCGIVENLKDAGYQVGIWNDHVLSLNKDNDREKDND